PCPRAPATARRRSATVVTTVRGMNQLRSGRAAYSSLLSPCGRGDGGEGEALDGSAAPLRLQIHLQVRALLLRAQAQLAGDSQQLALGRLGLGFLRHRLQLHEPADAVQLVQARLQGEAAALPLVDPTPFGDDGDGAEAELREDLVQVGSRFQARGERYLDL